MKSLSTIGKVAIGLQAVEICALAAAEIALMPKITTSTPSPLAVYFVVLCLTEVFLFLLYLEAVYSI